MKKSLGIIFALGTLFALVPNALALTKAFQVNTLSGGTLTTGLVSYWNMEGNSNDYYGANNGVDTAMSYGLGFGKILQGANFNGTSSGISISRGDATTYPGFSYALWVKYTTTFSGAAAYLVGGQATADNADFSLYIDPTTNFLSVNTYNGSIANTIINTAKTNDGVYHFVVAVKNGATLTLYVDNVQVATGASGSFNVSPTLIGLGHLNIQNNSFYKGSMDKVGIWSKALSTQEMTDLWNGGAGQTMCNGTGGPLCSIPRRHQIVLNPFEAKFEHFIFA